MHKRDYRIISFFKQGKIDKISERRTNAMLNVLQAVFCIYQIIFLFTMIIYKRNVV